MGMFKDLGDEDYRTLMRRIDVLQGDVKEAICKYLELGMICLLYTSPSPRD